LRRITRADALGFFSRRALRAKATAIFTDRFNKNDGERHQVPVLNPDFVPLLQRARSDDENTFSHHGA
jgi:hypothetical protein